MPLALTVKFNKPVFIGNDIIVTARKCRNSNAVRLDVSAPQSVAIVRQKVAQRYHAAGHDRDVTDALLRRDGQIPLTVEAARCLCPRKTTVQPTASLSQEIKEARKQ